MIPLNKAQLTHLIAKLGSDQAVASRYHVSRQTIFNLRKQYEIPPAENKKTKRNLVMREKYQHGVTPLHLSLQYNISLAQVYRILHPTEGKKIPRNPQKVITPQELEQHILQKGAHAFSHLWVTATPLTPTFLSMLKRAKETPFLVIHCYEEEEGQEGGYSNLYAELRLVDYVVVEKKSPTSSGK